MLERVSEDLVCNPVDVVLEHRKEVSLAPFPAQLEEHRAIVFLRIPKFLTGGREHVFQTALRRAKAKVLNGIAPLADRLCGPGDRGIDPLDGLFGIPGNEVASRLEKE